MPGKADKSDGILFAPDMYFFLLPDTVFPISIKGYMKLSLPLRQLDRDFIAVG